MIGFSFLCCLVGFVNAASVSYPDIYTVSTPPPAPTPAPLYSTMPTQPPPQVYQPPQQQGYSMPAPTPAPVGGYNQPNCKTTYETMQVDKCERYNEKVCYTTQQENCKDISDQNCNAIVSSQQVRQCFNVTELKCRLQESVTYETVQAVFTVQKCHTVTERVCDTVYETEEGNKNDFQCIMVSNPSCSNVDQTLYDKTCRTTTKFDCDYSSGGYGAQGGAVAGYGAPEQDYCKRSYNTQCYNTPRIVNNEVCVERKQEVCEKLTNSNPSPKEKQVCRNAEKKVCELEQRSQPKQIKKYTYTTNCRSVPRQVCDNAQIKKLMASCVPITRKVCTYNPIEKCEDVPKDYCYKIPQKIAKQKCYEAGYQAEEDSYESS